jgi:hypothetical protein
MSEHNAPTHHDWLIAAAGNPYLHQLAATIPEREGGPGRRRTHPVFVGLLYVLTAGGITGSHRSAARLLGSETAWRAVRLAHRRTKEAAGEALPRRAPSRGQLEALRKHLAKHVDLIREHAKALAVRQAREAGCFTATGSTTDLRRSDMLIGDGKVVAAPILSKTADRWLAQGRPIDTGKHMQAGEGSGVYVTGSKFLLMGVRADQARNARIILDTAYLPPGKGYGGEAGVAVTMAQRLQQLIANCGGTVRGICFDGAFRSAHIAPLMVNGLVVLSPVHPHAATRQPLELVRNCPCGRLHRLETQDGAICETQVMDTGEQHTAPCPIKKLVKRRNLRIAKAHRWYQEVELSCGTAKRLRIDITEEDERTGFKRAERIRQHAPGSPVYQNAYGYREDAESWNNTLDRTLYGGRMIACTAAKQLLFMIGFMLARNILAHRALQRLPQQPSA